MGRVHACRGTDRVGHAGRADPRAPGQSISRTMNDWLPVASSRPLSLHRWIRPWPNPWRIAMHADVAEDPFATGPRRRCGWCCRGCCRPAQRPSAWLMPGRHPVGDDRQRGGRRLEPLRGCAPRAPSGRPRSACRPCRRRSGRARPAARRANGSCSPLPSTAGATGQCVGRRHRRAAPPTRPARRAAGGPARRSP